MRQSLGRGDLKDVGDFSQVRLHHANLHVLFTQIHQETENLKPSLSLRLGGSQLTTILPAIDMLLELQDSPTPYISSRLPDYLLVQPEKQSPCLRSSY